MIATYHRKEMKILPFLFSLILPVVVYAQPLDKPVIHQRPKASCARCHTRYFRDEPRLSTGEEKFCYMCHGNEERVKLSERRKKVDPDFVSFDLEKEFSKPSHHPVEKSGIHRSRREILPEVDPNAKRHCECVDCHEVHRSLKRDKKKIEKGKKKDSTYPEIVYEYQLCYKCHSYSANLPFGRTNKAIEFQTTNPSFHPLEGEGKNSNVPSLLPPYSPKSILNCTDCHNNDNPRGPEGPHGSIYAPILVKKYTANDGDLENEFTYALCYQCHSRQSILGNQSFTRHSLHIVDKKISCYSCHNSHGSVKYSHLVEFRFGRVFPDSFGRLEFVDEGEFRGRCYLKCHEIEHNPKTY